MQSFEYCQLKKGLIPTPVGEGLLSKPLVPKLINLANKLCCYSTTVIKTGD